MPTNKPPAAPLLPGLGDGKGGVRYLGQLLPAIQPPTRTTERIIDASVDIRSNPPERLDFLHTVLCQVGMPRKQVEGRTFERKNGGVSLLLEAGRLWRNSAWVEQPLPYGTKPRLVMMHVSSEAIRTKNRTIEIGASIREFLMALGIDTSGGAKGGYTMFRKQMEALAACRLSLGLSIPGRDVTIDTKPISRFEAWTHDRSGQQSLWPGVMELSQEFYDTLGDSAVPLDHRALAAIKHSALALDVYTWLAHRLCRIDGPSVRLSWQNIKEQFGQEYHNLKDFQREFRQALKQATSVYPDAKIELVTGGLKLKASPPPVRKTSVVVTDPKTKS